MAYQLSTHLESQLPKKIELGNLTAELKNHADKG